MGFATEDVFDFVMMNVLHNTSVGIAGSPGAGKTTFSTCLLKFFSKNKNGNNRIVTIEEAREMELSEHEEFNPGGGHRRMISRVLQWNTTHSAEKPVTARMLIRQSLRVNPAIIVPAEMRGGEAMEAVEAGQTGVQIVSTFHAWGAKDGYLRVLSMCQMAGSSASESTIMSQIIQAFPIMVFIKKDDDGVRRIHEIFEATGVKDGGVVGNTIYRFVRTKVVENEEGRIIKIYGDFVQCDSISKELRKRLIQHGAKRAMVDRYYFTENRGISFDDYDESNVEVEVVITNPENQDNLIPCEADAFPAPEKEENISIQEPAAIVEPETADNYTPDENSTEMDEIPTNVRPDEIPVNTDEISHEDVAAALPDHENDQIAREIKNTVFDEYGVDDDEMPSFAAPSQTSVPEAPPVPQASREEAPKHQAPTPEKPAQQAVPQQNTNRPKSFWSGVGNSRRERR